MGVLIIYLILILFCFVVLFATTVYLPVIIV